MNNQFSQKVSEILIYSKQEAIRLNSDHVGPEHLLLGLLKEGSGRAIEVLQKKLYVDLGTIKNEIEARIEKRFAQQRQMLDIHEKYYKELKKILTPKQLQRIYEKHPAGPRHDKRIGHKHAPAFGHGQHAAPCRECPQQPK